MAEMTDIRRVPYSMEAEQSVLGSILLKPECIDEVADILQAEDFYVSEHSEIYLSMQNLFLQSKQIDIVTLLDMMVKSGSYDAARAKDYVKLLLDTVPSAQNVKDYAKIVKDKSILRQLIGAADDISEAAYSGQGEVSDILDRAEQSIYGISDKNETKGFVHVRDVLLTTYDDLHALYEHKSDLRGTPTGFSSLDTVLVGMGKGDLILVGARPGMGKTSFALNIATNVARQTKKAVCVFSLEMSNEQLVSRMLSSEALIDSHTMRTGELQEDDWVKLAHASASLSGCDIWLDDTTGITVSGMKSKLRRVRNLGFVVIDYLQLMTADRRIDNRVLEIGDISRNLKIMAKELGVPVMVCAQLSRGPESRNDKRPMLSDLRDSGAIEQDADVVMFLYREDYYDKSKDTANAAECIIAKNRHGTTTTVNMNFQGQYTRFFSQDSSQRAEPEK